MYKQVKHLLDTILDLRSNRLIDNMGQAEVRKNTIQFLGILTLIGFVVIFMQTMGKSAETSTGMYGSLLLNIIWACCYLVALSVVYLVELSKVWCIRISLLIILGEGLVAIIRWIVYQDPSPGDGTVISVLLGLVLGAMFLPWTPKQTLLISIVWIVGAVSSLLVTQHSEDFSTPAAVFVYIAVTIPGIMISFFRLSRFQDQFDLHFIQSQYEEVRDELLAAKSIHERGFPKPKSSGEIRFTYVYRPMSQIGGDSIFASIEKPRNPNSPLTLVLFDVTGHGLSAALTANRLQGELMRILGEDPTVDPAELLSLMDRYVCLTLEDSAVLVTAVAIHADPQNEKIRVANAGHPAPLLRNARGGILRLNSTAPVLGVGMGSELKPIIEEHPFRAGDSILAYTDGVSESLNDLGELYSTKGVERVLSEDWTDSHERWPEKILADVENQRAGSASDDILIVELYRA